MAKSEDPEDVDPKALEIAQGFFSGFVLRPTVTGGACYWMSRWNDKNYIDDLARAITALLHERETYCPECGVAGECACTGNWKARASEAEAKLRERDEEIARLKAEAMAAPVDPRSWWELSGKLTAAEERAQKAEAALAKKDEALRRIKGLTNGMATGPFERLALIARIAREARGE